MHRAAALALSLLAGLLVIGLATSPILAEHLFSDEWLLVVAWLLTLAASCAAHVARGVLSGMGRFTAYARIIGGESAVRLVLALGLALVGVEVVGPYGLAVAAGPLVAVGLALWRQSGLLQPGPPASWSEVTTALAWLLAASALSMALVNSGPILLELLGDAADEDAAGRFLAGLIVARVPLFLFQAVQASLLPRLAEMAGAGRTAELRRHLAHLILLVGGAGVAGTLGAWLVGPQVVRLLFGGDFDLSHRTMVLLGLGSSAFMVASLLAQSSIAVGGHRRMAVAWSAGIVALVLTVAFSSDDLFLRVELAGVAGGLVALVAQAIVLQRLLARGAEISSGDLIEAWHDLSLEP